MQFIYINQVMEGKKPSEKGQQNEQSEDDTYLIEMVNLRQKLQANKSLSSWKRFIKHIKQYSTVYLLLFSTTFVVFLIWQMKLKDQMQAANIKHQYTQQSSNGNSKQNIFPEQTDKIQTQQINSQQKLLLKTKISQQNTVEPKAAQRSQKNQQTQQIQLKKINQQQQKALVANQKTLQIVQNAQKIVINGQNLYFPKSQPSYWPKAGITLQQHQFSIRLLALKDEDPKKPSFLAQQQRNYYQQKYNLFKYKKQLPLCVVVPSFNNVANDRHYKNMRSILMQNYANYHIVFIDDASTDETGKQIQAFLTKQTILPRHKYIIVKNKVETRATPNLMLAANPYCKSKDIFIIVDGDDQLLGRLVFRLVNAIFQEKQVWFMYTNYLPDGGLVGQSRPYPDDVIKNNKYRQTVFSTGHLRAFYTQLFRKIKEKDLKDDQGNYFRAAYDVAICLPILEMAHERVIYVPEITYFYNQNTGLNNRLICKQEQIDNDKMLRNRLKYSRLETLQSPVVRVQKSNLIYEQTALKQATLVANLKEPAQ